MNKKIKNIIQENGFYFSKFEKDQSFHGLLLNTPQPTKQVEEYVSQILEGFDIKSDKLHLVYEDITQGESHALHTHLTPCDFQVLIWAPKAQFKGRDFIYGTRTNLQNFHPDFGDICFMKTNDLDFIHGVAPMINDTLVRTLLISVNYTGKLGEHLTVKANDLTPF